MKMNLTEVEKHILNLMQKDFGFSPTPFKNLASELDMSEEKLIEKIRDLKSRGIITRVGPFFNLDKSNAYITLAAMKVPEENFQNMAEFVNSYLEVAHNYKRNHEFNMWFVLATSNEAEAEKVLSEIKNLTGIEPMNLPKLKEFSLDLFLEV